MGGALLQSIWNLPAKRLSPAEYQYLSDFGLIELNNIDHSRRYGVFRSFLGKESHGDIDFQVESISNDKVDWMKALGSISGYKPHKNGKTISIPINGFQCDFNFVGTENYEIAYIYNSYEIGNFMGRVADKLGLKFGHNGLWLKIPLSDFDSELPNHQFKEIVITKDAKEIFDILGFDLECVKRGFHNPTDMYEWVADSQFFDPKLFDFSALNSINRTRNKKRPNYANFVKWCGDKESNNALDNKEELRKWIISSFPDVQEEIDKAKKEILLNKERRDKFNGNMVREMFGLEGVKLGEFIVSFKEAHPEFERMLDCNSPESVRSLVTQHYFHNFMSLDKGM